MASKDLVATNAANTGTFTITVPPAHGRCEGCGRCRCCGQPTPQLAPVYPVAPTWPTPTWRFDPISLPTFTTC